MSMTRYVRFVAALLLALAPAIAVAGPGAHAATQPATQPATAVAGVGVIDSLEFMRFIAAPDGGALETAEVTFTNNAGVSVHLISAVHIADAAYYRSLNAEFQRHPVVLYEMVKPKGSPPPAPGQSGDSAVGAFQRFLKDTLGLAYQLDIIDYRAGNFFHADLDTETFERLQKQRGESFASIMLRQLLDALANPAGLDDNEQNLTDLLTRPDAQTQLKLLLAKQLGDMERVAAGLSGPDGSVILTERNKAAVAILKTQLAAGKTDIAIFYGAAHMPDLSERLRDMGFHPTTTTWRPAWTLRIDPNRPSIVEQIMNP